MQNQHKLDNEALTDIIRARLRSYPGAHPSERWKRDTDLTHCTPSERAEMRRLGTSVEQLADFGLDRGEVHHILFGYRYAEGRRHA